MLSRYLTSALVLLCLLLPAHANAQQTSKPASAQSPEAIKQMADELEADRMAREAESKAQRSDADEEEQAGPAVESVEGVPSPKKKTPQKQPRPLPKN